jgi:hypothetical protein
MVHRPHRPFNGAGPPHLNGQLTVWARELAPS